MDWTAYACEGVLCLRYMLGAGARDLTRDGPAPFCAPPAPPTLVGLYCLTCTLLLIGTHLLRERRGRELYGIRCRRARTRMRPLPKPLPTCEVSPLPVPTVKTLAHFTLSHYYQQCPIAHQFVPMSYRRVLTVECLLLIRGLTVNKKSSINSLISTGRRVVVHTNTSKAACRARVGRRPTTAIAAPYAHKHTTRVPILNTEPCVHACTPHPTSRAHRTT